MISIVALSSTIQEAVSLHTSLRPWIIVLKLATKNQGIKYMIFETNKQTKNVNIAGNGSIYSIAIKNKKIKIKICS